MDEKKMSIVLEALAETIDRLRLDLRLAQSRNKMLEDENDMLNKELEAKERENG